MKTLSRALNPKLYPFWKFWRIATITVYLQVQCYEFGNPCISADAAEK